MNYGRLKKVDLERELERFGVKVPPKATKEELIERLIQQKEQRRAERGGSDYFIYEDCHLWSTEQLREALFKLGLSRGGSRDQMCRRLAEYTALVQARGTVIPRALVDPREITISSPEPSVIPSPDPATIWRTFTMDQCDETTVPVLKRRLRAAGQPVSGRKSLLCQRLASYEQQGLSPQQQLHNLILIDPETFTGEQRRGGEYLHGVKFSLNGKMFNLLQTDPQEYTTRRGKACLGRAYVYGPLLDVTEYSALGSLEINGTFAIIDHDALLHSQEVQTITIYQDFSELPVQITLYGHLNVKGLIDSLIIEDDCLFTL